MSVWNHILDDDSDLPTGRGSFEGEMCRLGHCNIPMTYRVTRGLSSRDHVRPALKELHWLPVAHRIQYKVAHLMFMVHDNRCLVYLSEPVQPVSSNPVRQRCCTVLIARFDVNPNKRRLLLLLLLLLLTFVIPSGSVFVVGWALLYYCIDCDGSVGDKY